ncbi:MAG: hypothetical protein RBT11_04985 [Desulfobacterales bacterium]|jgi:hypothetical protein|nr:hypothetical protein [Desulfobacterales bacterium]
MDFKAHLETAWKLTLSHIIPLIFMTLVMAVVSALTFGLLAPVTMAGYIHAIILLVRDGREPKIQDIFSQMRLFVPLLLFGIVTGIAVMIGFMLLVLPGLLIILALSFCCLYMIPLMTDKGLGLMDAIKESYQMAIKGQIVDHIVLVVLYLGITAVGGSIFVGFLFTCPLATMLLASVYLENTGGAVTTIS